jgi:dolichyl-diphosphooligosaccharide--protein glycosyltransferase
MTGLRWLLILAVMGVALWLRLLPTALPALDESTRASFRYQGDDGREHVYLGDYDSYAWLRTARNYLRLGTTCDEVVGGVCRDTFTNAPVGVEQRYGRSLHIAAIVGLHRVLTLFEPAYPLMASAFLVPVVAGVLAVLPAFGIGRRLGGDVAGLAAAAAVACNPFFFSRTVGSDNDVWNVVLPLGLVWAMVRALEARTLWSRAAWTVVAAGFVALHAATWRGWLFFYGTVLAGVAGYLALLAIAALRRHERDRSVPARVWQAIRNGVVVLGAFYVACLVATQAVGIERSYVRIPLDTVAYVLIDDPEDVPPSGATDTLAWPNVFETVGELFEPLRADIALALGGPLASLVGCAGFVLLLLPWHDWRWWHGATLGAGLVLLSPLLFGPEPRPETALVLLAALVVTGLARALLDADPGGESGLGARVLVGLWFFAAATLAIEHARYVLLLIAPFGLVFGHAIGRLHALVASAAPRLAAPLALSTLVAMLAPTAAMTHQLASNHRPQLHDPWWDAFIAIRDRTPPETIVSAWWDYGYWAKYAAERRVSADGSSLKTRIPFWLARSLVAASEAEAVGLLRMLSCGSAAFPEPEGAASAFAKLERHGIAGARAYGAVLELASHDRGTADAYLHGLGLDAEARADVLAATHCEPDPTVLVLGSEQARMIGWKALGRWDPRRPPEDEEVLWRDDLLTYDWVPCRVEAQGRWRCPVPDAPDGRPSWLREVSLDPAVPESARVVVLREERARGAAEATGTPSLVVLAGAFGLREVSVASAVPARIAVLADLMQPRVLVGPADLVRSTFVQLMFLDGRYARLFEKMDEHDGLGGVRVVTWRVRAWDAHREEQPSGGRTE